MKDMAELHQQIGENQLASVIQRHAKPMQVDRQVASRYDGARKNELPEVIDIMDFLGTPLPKPPELIKGILHKGSKLILSGASKSRKTWALAHLALCVATGQPWWGFSTTPGKVLYANFELGAPYFQERLLGIKEKLFIEGSHLQGQIKLWNLRGHATDLADLADKVIAKANGKYDLIILDPIYKVLGDRDENSNGQMAELMNIIDRIIEATGAAVAFAHHYSKGNQSKKNAMDRMSGAGVFARDADSLLMMTDHQLADTYAVHAVLRNHKPVPPFCVTLEHPIMVRWDGADPTNLKTANGSEKKYFVADLMRVLGDQELINAELERQYRADTNASTGTFDKLIKEARGLQLVEKTADGKRWKATAVGVKDD